MEQKEGNYLPYLKRFSNILLINGGFLDNPGLFTGEMGIVLFILRYARFLQNELYADFGFDLINKIQSNIHIDTPIDYKQGLAGIGSAFEYLVQYEYIKADTDEVLEELDNRLFSFDKMPYLSVEDMIGIGYYAIWRIAGNSRKKHTIIKTVLPTIICFIEERNQNNHFVYLVMSVLNRILANENDIEMQDLKTVLNSLQASHHQYPYGLEENVYNRIMEQFSSKEHGIEKTIDLGLLNGLSGFGMALMNQLDGDDSWISLLPDDIIQKKYESLPL